MRLKLGKHHQDDDDKTKTREFSLFTFSQLETRDTHGHQTPNTKKKTRPTNRLTPKTPTTHTTQDRKKTTHTPKKT